MFKNLFGGKKEKKKPAANIDETIAMLDKKIKDMELLINNLEVRQNAMQEEAKKKIKAGDKAGAKRILVKKKKIVEQIKQNEGALMMMEEQKGMLENSATTKGVIDAVKKATEVIKENKGHSLVSINLETGRTHQIRVHFKYIGHPLIGDQIYNPDMEYMNRQALHSHKIQFTHPITEQPMEFVAELPPDMKNVFN